MDAPQTSAGYVQGWWTDPIGLWVNSEQIDLAWTWTNDPWFGCTGLYSYSRSVPTYFYGWYNASNAIYPDYECRTVRGGFTLTHAGAQTWSNWKNDVFPGCFANQVNIYYSPLSIRGDNVGSLFGGIGWSITGPGVGCIDLLTPNFQLYRTYN